MSAEVPEDLLNMLLPDQGNNFVIDLLRREIWITGSIHGGIARPVVRGLRQMALLSTAPITIFVNSEGGDPYEAMIIADVMHALTERGTLVRSCVMGVSYSAGTIISSAGARGHRTAIPSADFLVHQLSVNNVGGKVEDLEAATESFKRLNRRLCQYLARAAGCSFAEMEGLMSKESYLDARGAQELGLIDRIEIPGISEGEMR